MDTQNFLWTGAIGMAVGGAALLRVGQRRTSAEETQTIIHGIVPLIAACSYFAMAVGQGSTVLPDGRLFFFARYVDWLFTTPLLLLSLALSGIPTAPKRYGLLAGLLLADVMMVVTGFAFGASITPAVKWTWYAISCGAFAAIGYVMAVPLLEATAGERGEVQSAYRRHTMLLAGLWTAYPIIIIPAPDGLGLMPEATATGLLMVLDLVSKVGYGLLTTKSDAAITSRTLAETRQLR